MKVVILGHGVFALANAYRFLKAGWEVTLIGHSWLEGAFVYCYPLVPNHFEPLKRSLLGLNFFSCPERVDQPLTSGSILWLISRFKDGLKNGNLAPIAELSACGEKIFLEWKNELVPRLWNKAGVWDYGTFWQALHEHLKQSESVSFIEGSQVKKWHKKPGKIKKLFLGGSNYVEADLFIMTGGYDMKKQMKKMKISLNIQPITSYSVEISQDSLGKKILNNLHYEDSLLFINLIRDKIYVSGFRDLAGWKHPPQRRRHAYLLRNASSMLDIKVKKHCVIKYHSALFPSLSTGLPVIGKSSKYHNFYMSTSYSNLNSFGICGATQMLFDLVHGQDTKNCPFVRTIKHFA